MLVKIARVLFDLIVHHRRGLVMLCGAMLIGETIGLMSTLVVSIINRTNIADEAKKKFALMGNCLEHLSIVAKQGDNTG